MDIYIPSKQIKYKTWSEKLFPKQTDISKKMYLIIQSGLLTKIGIPRDLVLNILQFGFQNKKCNKCNYNFPTNSFHIHGDINVMWCTKCDDFLPDHKHCTHPQCTLSDQQIYDCGFAPDIDKCMYEQCNNSVKQNYCESIEYKFKQIELTKEHYHCIECSQISKCNCFQCYCYMCKENQKNIEYDLNYLEIELHSIDMDDRLTLEIETYIIDAQIILWEKLKSVSCAKFESYLKVFWICDFGIRVFRKSCKYDKLTENIISIDILDILE
jgi:hypothetical protein